MDRLVTEPLPEPPVAKFLEPLAAVWALLVVPLIGFVAYWCFFCRNTERASCSFFTFRRFRRPSCLTHWVKRELETVGGMGRCGRVREMLGRCRTDGEKLGKIYCHRFLRYHSYKEPTPPQSRSM